MLTKRIIPCLDVDAGRVVKGTRFTNLRDAGDPVLVAGHYDEQGADEIVFLDITASHQQRKILLDVVTRTAETVFMPLTVGGGVRTLNDIRELLKAGADKVAINTAAVAHPQLVKKAALRFGTQCIVVAIDAKRTQPARARKKAPKKWNVFTHGGRKDTKIDAVAWAKKMEKMGAGEIFLTSMDRDGTKEGDDLDLTRAMSEAKTIPVIASGGVGPLEHLYEGLTTGRADAVLAASIFHEKQYTVAYTKKYLAEKKVPVRL